MLIKVPERLNSSEPISPERINANEAALNGAFNGKLDTRNLASTASLDGLLATSHLMHTRVPIPIQFTMTFGDADRMKYSIQMQSSGIVLGAEIAPVTGATDPSV